MSWASANELKNSNEKYNTSTIIDSVLQHFDIKESVFYTCLIIGRVRHIKKIAFYLLYAHSSWDYREISKHFRCTNALVAEAIRQTDPNNVDIVCIRSIIKCRVS